MRNSLLVLVLAAVTPLLGQQAPAFDFSIKNIMRGPELYGRQPQSVRSSAASRWFYFTWRQRRTDWREPVTQSRVRGVPGARPERVSPHQIDSTGARFAAS